MGEVCAKVYRRREKISFLQLYAGAWRSCVCVCVCDLQCNSLVKNSLHYSACLCRPFMLVLFVDRICTFDCVCASLEQKFHLRRFRELQIKASAYGARVRFAHTLGPARFAYPSIIWLTASSSRSASGSCARPALAGPLCVQCGTNEYELDKSFALRAEQLRKWLESLRALSVAHSCSLNWIWNWNCRSEIGG